MVDLERESVLARRAKEARWRDLKYLRNLDRVDFLFELETRAEHAIDEEALEFGSSEGIMPLQVCLQVAREKGVDLSLVFDLVSERARVVISKLI